MAILDKQPASHGVFDVPTIGPASVGNLAGYYGKRDTTYEGLHGKGTVPTLRPQRQAAGLSVSRLARLSRTSDLLVNTAENGAVIRAGDVLKLAAALSVPLSELGWLER